jgi:hypothetical protein
MGCASSTTYKQQFVGVEDKLQVHDYKTILVDIEESKERCYKKKDQVLYYLDVGLLNHFAGNWRASNVFLEEAEKSIESAYTRSVSRAAASMLLNDNVLEYAGEAHEDLYLNIFKALNYAKLGEFDSAMVEVRRIGNKLNMLEDKNAKFAEKYNQSKNSGKRFKQGHNRFHDSALARYLSMIMYRANGNADDARIDRDRIKAIWESTGNIYTFRMPSFATTLMPPPDGYAKLNVISFIGRLPDKLARTLYIKTQPRSITITTTRQTDYNRNQVKVLEVIRWRGSEPLPRGMQMKFQVPYLKMRPSRVGSIRLMLNNHELGRFSTIESMDKVASEIFKVKKPLIYLKTVMRTAIKSIACAAAVKELQSHSDGQKIPPELIEFMFSFTENADLRVSQFFPASANICEIDVPVGVYSVGVVYYDHNGMKIFTDDLGSISVKSEKLNLLESFYLN